MQEHTHFRKKKKLFFHLVFKYVFLKKKITSEPTYLPNFN